MASKERLSLGSDVVTVSRRSSAIRKNRRTRHKENPEEAEGQRLGEKRREASTEGQDRGTEDNLRYLDGVESGAPGECGDGVRWPTLRNPLAAYSGQKTKFAQN